MDTERAAFELNSRHTLSIVRAIPDGAWDAAPGGSAVPLRAQLTHLALVRESICRCLANVDTAGLGAVFEGPEWRGGTAALAEAFETHVARCRTLLTELRAEDLDRPFETRFGNRSTPRSYLRVMLVEEVHHRAQMTAVMRVLGLQPPPFPGKAWVELGVDQD